MSVRQDTGFGPTAPGADPEPPFENAVEAAQRYLLSIRRRTGIGAASWKATRSWSPSTADAALSWTVGRAALPEARRVPCGASSSPSGGWAIYEGGPAEVSSSVKAYFVLKLVGDDPAAPHMARAREAILALGGIEACNSFTRIYLAIFGQCTWDDSPAVPPEIMLLPDSGSSTSTRCPPGSARHRRAAVGHLGLQALLPGARHAAIRSCTCRARRGRPFAGRAGHGGSALAPLLHRGGRDPQRMERPTHALRKKALAACEKWIHERLAHSDGLGAIFPPIINTIIAFRCLGYAVDDPRVSRQVHGAREARDRGRGHAPPPAVLLADLGHRPGDRGAVRRGPRGRRPGAPERGALAPGS